MFAICLCLFLGEESRADPTAETLLVGVEQWQREVSFRSTFRLRAGFAKTLDQALRGEMDATIKRHPASVFQATGVFHKLGSRVRYAVDYGGPVHMGGEEFTNVAFDEVTDCRVDVAYSPWERTAGFNLGLAAYVHRRHKSLRGTMHAGIHSHALVSPLKPFPNTLMKPFVLSAVTAVNPVDDNHIEVVTRDELYGNRHERRVLFWTKPSVPVVEKITQEDILANGKRHRTVVLLSDFKKCPGGMVPRRVLHVEEGVRAPVYLQEWRSDDLGKVLPTDTDFVIGLPPGTEILGVKPGTSLASARTLDASKIELGDLIDVEARTRALEEARPARMKKP